MGENRQLALFLSLPKDCGGQVKCAERTQACGEGFPRSVENLPADFHKLKMLKSLVQYFRAPGHLLIIQLSANAETLHGSQTFYPEKFR